MIQLITRYYRFRFCIYGGSGRCSRVAATPTLCLRASIPAASGSGRTLEGVAFAQRNEFALAATPAAREGTTLVAVVVPIIEDGDN